jgi:uncharacterized protein (DUF2267 family)
MSPPVNADEVMLAVADRAHADPFDAQRAIEAVLDALAECLHGDAFAAEVAERAHLSPTRAREFTGAVLAALREHGIPERYWATLIRSG